VPFLSYLSKNLIRGLPWGKENSNSSSELLKLLEEEQYEIQDNSIGLLSNVSSFR